MKLFFAYDYAHSGTWSVLSAMAIALRAQGHTVDEMAVNKGQGIPEGFDLTLSEYDAAQFWNARAAIPFVPHITPPFGMTIHGWVVGAEDIYFQYLHRFAPEWVHVMDAFSEQFLIRRDIACFRTPQCFRHDGFTKLPLPANPTVGYLGGDSEGFKRFWVIEQAAHLMGLPCIGHNASDEWLAKEDVLTLYSRMSLYANAAVAACGPVTLQEAMLCGRPALTTRTSTMEAIIRPGYNGEFFDGSARDAARKGKKIIERLDWYSKNAAETPMESAEEAASLFITGIEEAQQ